MGAEPDYSFRFVVARRDGERWREVRPQQLRWPWQARSRLGDMWARIWQEPAAGGGATSSP
jgi:inner membrane protein